VVLAGEGIEMKSAKWRWAVFSLVAVAVAATMAPRGLCRCQRGLDMRGWRLPQLVEQLKRSGLPLRVVPSRQDGKWDNTIYLTQDRGATWETFQAKNLTVDRASEWQGSVYVHHIGPWTDAETYLTNWQGNGFRAGDFLFFGDKVQLERISDALKRPKPR
jgi:hypothetical protein